MKGPVEQRAHLNWMLHVHTRRGGTQLFVPQHSQGPRLACCAIPAARCWMSPREPACSPAVWHPCRLSIHASACLGFLFSPPDFLGLCAPGQGQPRTPLQPGAGGLRSAGACSRSAELLIPLKRSVTYILIVWIYLASVICGSHCIL